MIKNCFNYVGSKDRILSQIDANLNKDKSIFIDAFCGSGVVGVNEVSNYYHVFLNDACWQLIEVLRYFTHNEIDDIIMEIEKVIQQYELSKTNKQGYNNLRDFYNSNTSLPESFNPVVFYCLLAHSFNYNIHITKTGKFSVPFGQNRSYFSDSLKNKLINFQRALHRNAEKFSIFNYSYTDFFKFAKSRDLIKDSMIYIDPPYLSSDSSYGRIAYLGKWDAQKEKALYDTLDYINKLGGSFLLSNVVENNGKENEVLKKWASRYNIIEVSSDYTNCNYQRKNAGKTKEVLIRNY